MSYFYKNNLKHLFILLLAMNFLFVQCGGEGSSSTATSTTEEGDNETTTEEISSFSVPSQLSLILSTDTATTESINTSFATAPTTGAFSTDTVVYTQYERTLEPLDNINDIFCGVAQTKYSQFVNKGAYIALVDKSKCISSAVSSSEDEEEGQNDQTEIEQWFISVTQDSEFSPMTVNLWIYPITNGREDDEEKGNSVVTYMEAQLIVYEGATTNHPNGVFTFDFKGSNLAGSRILDGALSVEQDLDNAELDDIQLTLNHRALNLVERVHAKLNNAAKTGVLKTSKSNDSGVSVIVEGTGETEIEEGEEDNSGIILPFSINDEEENSTNISYYVSYDENYYNRSVTLSGNTSTTCLDRDDFTEVYQSYKIYNADGSNLDWETEVPFKYTTSDDEVLYSVLRASSFYLDGYSSTDMNGEEIEINKKAYDISVGKGTLTKYATKQEALLNIKNVDLYYRKYGGGSGRWIIRWDGSVFKKIKEYKCVSGQPCGYEDMETITDLTVSIGQSLYLKRSLYGSSLTIVVPTGGLTNNSLYSYSTTSTIYPEEFNAPITLYCYSNCLKSNLTEADYSAGTIYYADKNTAGDPAYVYTFDPSDYSLKKGGNPVYLELGGTAYNYGGTGNLFTTTLADPGDYDYSITKYKWATSSSSNTRLTTVHDKQGNRFKLHSELECEYAAKNEKSLTFEGEGPFGGISKKKVLEDTTTGFNFWGYEYNIPNGSELLCYTTSYTDQAEFINIAVHTKATRIDRLMKDVSVDNCTQLDLTNPLSESILKFEDPEIGSLPTVTEDPLVIGGTVVTE